MTAALTVTPPAEVRELLLEVARPADLLLNMASPDVWLPPMRRITHGYPPYVDQEYDIVYVEMPTEHQLLQARRAVRQSGVLVFSAIGSAAQHSKRGHASSTVL